MVAQALTLVALGSALGAVAGGQVLLGLALFVMACVIVKAG